MFFIIIIPYCLKSVLSIELKKLIVINLMIYAQKFHKTCYVPRLQFEKHCFLSPYTVDALDWH